MKKRNVVMAVAALMVVSAVTGYAGKAVSNDSTFIPKGTTNWTVMSSLGGGSDICTRMISDIMMKENLVSGQPIIVTNKTNGNDEIGRNEMTTTKENKADYTLLTSNSGDLVPTVQNTKNRSSNLRILAIVTVDKQLIFKGEQTKYADFREATEATKNGTKIIIGGSKGDDIATYDAMLEEVGISKDVMSYVTYDSIDDTIMVALGGCVEFVISRPAAAPEHVAADSLIPVLTLSMERYTGNLADAPTLDEIGDYENVEVPVWRGVATPVAVSNTVAAYWDGQLGKVTEIDIWKNDHLEKNKLIGNYMDTATAARYVTVYEKDYVTASRTQQMRLKHG